MASTQMPARSSLRLRTSRKKPKPDRLQRTAIKAGERKRTRTDKQIVNAYRDALINIWKLAAVCWDGRRQCHDSGFVAGMVLADNDPALFKKLDGLRYDNVKIDRAGKLTINFKGTRVKPTWGDR